MKNKDIRWIRRLANYTKALNQLKKAVDLASERELSDLEQQGLIQGFEYTHELAWKTLKDFLDDQGYKDIYGLKDATRMAFNLNLVIEGEIWMDMIKSRNQTSHTYNEKVTKKIILAIKDEYFDEFVSLYDKLTELKDKQLNG